MALVASQILLCVARGELADSLNESKLDGSAIVGQVALMATELSIALPSLRVDNGSNEILFSAEIDVSRGRAQHRGAEEIREDDGSSRILELSFHRELSNLYMSVSH